MQMDVYIKKRTSRTRTSEGAIVSSGLRLIYRPFFLFLSERALRDRENNLCLKMILISYHQRRVPPQILRSVHCCP